jgi:glycosyltransferase involved in cell wall biosynthesis
MYKRKPAISYTCLLILSSVTLWQFTFNLSEGMGEQKNEGNTRSSRLSRLYSDIIPRAYSAHESLHVVDEGAYSLVAACQLRGNTTGLNNFEKAFQSWLSVDKLKEIVLVDWASAIPLSDIVDEYRYKIPSSVSIIILRVKTSDKFRISVAYNQAFKLVGLKNILKVDCDTRLSPQLLQYNAIGHQVLKYQVVGPAIRYRCGVNFANVDENSMHLNGVFVAPTEAIKGIGGFDERFVGYGWDDSNLYMRLNIWRGCSDCNVPTIRIKDDIGEPLIYHIPHGRHASAVNERFGTCFNREVSLMLPSNYDDTNQFYAKWSRGMDPTTCDIDRPSARNSSAILLSCDLQVSVDSYQKIYQRQGLTDKCLKIVFGCKKEQKKRFLLGSELKQLCPGVQRESFTLLTEMNTIYYPLCIPLGLVFILMKLRKSRVPRWIAKIPWHVVKRTLWRKFRHLTFLGQNLRSRWHIHAPVVPV